MARLCPHCENRSAFKMLHSTNEGRWGRPGNDFGVLTNVLKCAECKGVIIVFSVMDEQNQWSEFIAYPASMPSVNEYVPEAVAKDYISGVNCMAIREYKAAAAMFRRSLQQIMIEKNAKKDDLWKQINDLESRGIITAEIKAWAHEIRFWGNDGAHPATDYLDEISLAEVTEVKEFLERVFDYVYIMPGKLEASRLSRNAKKSTTP